MEFDSIKDELLDLLNKAYAPYSNYKVASIVVMKDGKTFKGVNVENASFGATICAERNAITSAVTEGYKKGDFDSIYVMADSGKHVSPCFICRQLLVEFFDPMCKVILVDKDGVEKIYTVNNLTPLPFSSEDL